LQLRVFRSNVAKFAIEFIARSLDTGELLVCGAHGDAVKSIRCND
jgi:hypothetical protein